MWKKLHEDKINHAQFNIDTANFEAEQQIINDKKEFGRVRASLMRHLESKYGFDIARRALRRVNTRQYRDYFRVEITKGI
jgi:hypothetical protein